jgi:hypothetical protein
MACIYNFTQKGLKIPRMLTEGVIQGRTNKTMANKGQKYKRTNTTMANKGQKDEQ